MRTFFSLLLLVASRATICDAAIYSLHAVNWSTRTRIAVHLAAIRTYAASMHADAHAGQSRPERQAPTSQCSRSKALCTSAGEQHSIDDEAVTTVANCCTAMLCNNLLAASVAGASTQAKPSAMHACPIQRPTTVRIAACTHALFRMSQAQNDCCMYRAYLCNVRAQRNNVYCTAAAKANCEAPHLYTMSHQE